MSPFFLLLLSTLVRNSGSTHAMRNTDNSDLLVKVVHVNDTTRVSLLSDNTKSIRSATWDPTGKYLVRVLVPPSLSPREVMEGVADIRQR
jgi:hypothetical protein